ncbi:MAG TPA: hypothetical protein P5186_23630 [Candidatus Paceibacterota bacterium]|nr:hypothetical protein [Verrucomicrobiota bacterium]HRY51050.1 hypothetical protein [Candidatus Paceibacterota bacterium]
MTWQKWHHFVFTKKADQKNIYIDGELFLNGSSSNPLKSDFNELALGTDGVPGADFMHGMIDDFAVFSTEINAANAVKLATGSSPKEITDATLIAYWDFNDGGVKPTPTISIERSGANVVITFTGTLQSADSVTGPWTDVPGASPATIPAQGIKFYRAAN